MAQNGALRKQDLLGHDFLVLLFAVCLPQTMPKSDYNTVEDNNLQTSVQLKSGRCLKLSDKICRICQIFYRSL